MAEVIAVCKSEKKGIRKKVVPEACLREGFGMLDDAHADSATHRQVSLLAAESIEKMRSLGVEVGPGDFAENLTTQGIDLVSLPIGINLRVGEEVVLELTQIGKECHAGCAIFRQVGTCIMPKEGVFASVVCGGVIKPGDPIRIGKVG